MEAKSSPSAIVVIDFKESNYPRKAYDSDGRRNRGSSDPYAPSRVYIDFKGESIYDNINNRRQRPSTTLKPLVKDVLEKNGIAFDKIRWSSKAGCTMCPCSPGFLIDGNFGKALLAYRH